jgi:hypothetical protein
MQAWPVPSKWHGRFPEGREVNENHGCFYGCLTLDRFYIVDIAVLQQLQNAWASDLQRIVKSYDMGCRYKKKLHERSLKNPATPLAPEFQDRLMVGSSYLECKVNVWHGRGHNPECADEHSLRNTRNVGRMTGEDIESPWAKIDHLQYSTREMDAGGRRDCIVSHMLKQNEEKKRQMGEKIHWHLLAHWG